MDATPQAPHEEEPPVSYYTQVKLAVMGYINRAETHGDLGGLERLKVGSRYFPDSAAVDFVIGELQAVSGDKAKIDTILSGVYAAIESYPARSESGEVVKRLIQWELFSGIVKRQALDMALIEILQKAMESVARETADALRND